MVTIAKKSLLGVTLMTLAGAAMPTVASANGGYYNGQTPHEACKADERSDKLAGAVIGGVVGAVLGSQVSGDGQRTEGSYIGAGLGALAGAGIADKQVDCDPSYGNPQPVYNGSYGDGGYSQPVRYDDRVTYSNHPVYSNPTYGAGAVQQGTTYHTGTTSYPPAQTYGQQTYGQTTYTRAGYTQPSYTRIVQPTPVYTQVYPSVSYSNPGYVKPYKRKKARKARRHHARHHGYQAPRRVVQTGRHYHGDYVCHGSH